MGKWIGFLRVVCVLVGLGFSVCGDAWAVGENSHVGGAGNLALEGQKSLPALDFEACLELAFENNRQRTISKLSAELADLQYKQAMSSYSPIFELNASMVRFDEDLNFKAQIPGFPEMDVTALEQKIRTAELRVSLPLYTGGERPALAKKAKIGIDMSREDGRRTDLQIVYDVKRMYYAAVLSRRLYTLGREILSHYKAVQHITENFFSSGSMSVNKSDVLKIKTVTLGFESFVATLEGKVQLAQAGLINTLGLPYYTDILITEKDLPFQPLTVDLDALIGKAYVFNPDYQKALGEIEAMNLTVSEKKSGHKPKVFLAGKLFKYDSPNDVGLLTEDNNEGYRVGLYLRLPIFNGFFTKNEVGKARIGLKAAKEKRLILKEGLAIQIKNSLIRLNQYSREIKSLKEATLAAEDNTQLSLRAYESNIIDLGEVTEALILKSYMTMMYVTALYNHLETQAQMEFIIGMELDRMFKDKS